MINETKGDNPTDKAILFLSTGFFSGYSPVAPGTAGTVVGILIYILIRNIPPIAYLLITASLILIGVYISTESERILGRKDPQEVVIDEIAGILLSLLFLPPTFTVIIAAFIIFRVIDISKPFRFLEKLPGGWGIVIDDVAAGGATNLIVRALLAYQFLPLWI